MEIRFCDRCDSSIPQSDLDRGVARKVDGALLCCICLPRYRTRRRLTIALLPLAFLATAAVGAAVGVLAVRPRVEDLESRLASCSAGVEEVDAGLAGLRSDVASLRDLSEAQARATVDLSEELDEGRELVDRSLSAFAERASRLGEEIRGIKEFLAETAAIPPETEAPPDPTDPDTWLPLTADPDAGVRLSALVALGECPDGRVADRALELLGDADPAVRAQAAALLAARGEMRSIEPLIDLLADGNPRVRAVAVRSLRKLTGLELAGYDPADTPEVREAAVERIREQLSAK